MKFQAYYYIMLLSMIETNPIVDLFDYCMSLICKSYVTMFDNVILTNISIVIMAS